MNKEMESLVVLINDRNKETANGREIAEKLSCVFNRFGGYTNMAKELYDALSPAGKKKLMVCLSLAAMQMSHEWKACGYNSWDDRKKASLSFSYNNKLYFDKLFEKNAGFALEVEDNSPYFQSCVRYTQIKDTFMEGFLGKWVNIHSTLKQAFFGGMVQGVLVENTKTSFVPPLNYGEVFFPFI